MESQQEVWERIAPEWHEFKSSPSETATKFLKKSKGKILDFGSGSGRNLLEIKPNKKREFYLVDFSKKMLELAKKRAKENGIEIKTIQSRLEKIPLKDNFFDSAICVSAIHCIETEQKRKKAFEELLRVLKPKAKVLIGVWNKDSPRFKNKPKEKFVSWTTKGKRYYYLYEEKELRDLLKKIGFKIIKKIPHRANIWLIAEKP